MKSLNWMMCIFLFCGCVPLVGFGSLLREQYIRPVQLSAPMEPGTTFSADIHNGSITVHGSEEKAVRMTATIKAQATHLEEARELAEATTVELVPGRGGVETQIECPSTGGNRSVRVDVDVYMPASSNADVQTHNGDIIAEDCSGNLKAKSHNGNISTRNTNGDADLQTHNGRIFCMNFSGNVQSNTHNGPIRVVYGEGSDPVCNISLTSHNGGIELVSPPDFSALVQVSTYNGAISTDLPITVSGKMERNQLRGTIGTGEGRLYLETHNGSIEIQ